MTLEKWLLSLSRNAALPRVERCVTASGHELDWVRNTIVFACEFDVDIFYFQSSRSLWQLVRQRINRGSYKVTKSRGSPDESENRNDVSDDVEDIELV